MLMDPPASIALAITKINPKEEKIIPTIFFPFFFSIFSIVNSFYFIKPIIFCLSWVILCPILMIFFIYSFVFFKSAKISISLLLVSKFFNFCEYSFFV